MGVLKCACSAEAEGKTFEEADEKIDHGIALSRPGPACSGHPTRMTWDAKGGYDRDGRLIVKDPKPVASQEVVMLVGKESKKAKDSDDEKDKDPKTSSSPKDPLKKEKDAAHKTIAKSKLSAKDKNLSHEAIDRASKAELDFILKSAK